MRTACRNLLRLVLFTGLAASLHAQLGFNYRTSANPALVAVGNNGSILFAPTLVGSSSTVTVIVTNTTVTETLSLTRATVSGGPVKIAFSPGDLAPGASTSVTLTFTPTTRDPVSASLQMDFTRGLGTASYNFFLTGTGLAPNLVASYVLAPDGNQVPVSDGGIVTFPQTPVKGTATATFIILNQGNGPGSVNSVSLNSDQFKLAALPLLPAVVQPDKDVRFNVVFSPLSNAGASASLRIDVGGRVISIGLAGQGASATLVYEFVTSAGVTPIAAGTTVHLPDTAIGSTSSGVVRVRNTGNLDARVGAIAVVGSAFRLTDVPPLPATVPVGGALTFTLQFAPSATGAAAATLLIDGFSVAVDGTGVGARLTLASRVGSTVAPIPDGGGVTFPNTTLGSGSTVYIRISNTGNAPGTVNGISLNVAVFALGSLPPLPVTIGPGETVEFSVAFTPTATGAVTGTLQIDDRAVTLRGIGDSPPPLPAIVFTLPDTVSALDQPSVGLALAQPYGIDITGKLNLSFTPDSFADDPNIQFASGGRSVDFRIPANTTQAIFGESAQAVQLQAGTVAGVITVAPTFSAGAVNLTPNPAPSKTVVVTGGPPQVRNVQVGTRTATSFELLITGLATTRSITQFTLNFTAAPGANLQTTNLSVNVEAPFTAWYQSTAGRSFGSQFTASVIINVNGDSNAVQSVSVTAVNARGSSSPASVNLR